MAVLSVTVMGSQLPSDLLLWRIDPAALLIVVVWVVRAGSRLSGPQGAAVAPAGPAA